MESVGFTHPFKYNRKILTEALPLTKHLIHKGLNPEPLTLIYMNNNFTFLLSFFSHFTLMSK